MDKLIRAASAAFVIFAAVFAFIAGQRIDQMTIALLGGVMIGLLFTMPVLVVVVIALNRNRHAEEPIAAPEHYYSPMPQQPPQMWLTPAQIKQLESAQQPAYQMPQGYAAPPVFQLPPQRKFMVIGDNGEMTEAF
ncbi:MAG TPA: hypothetical protein PLW39_11030 [Thermoflexales bacterium]|nr:hypothetical protein [Thermoflexales bacterium]HQW35952.1 hypothetical protein [Thermoflexales bacterium]HQX74803.1 hypothetical protein [Thermoflexales bacterium]HQZ22787.1 hypothetical protein [Thermoflexales bacterium]